MGSLNSAIAQAAAELAAESAAATAKDQPAEEIQNEETEVPETPEGDSTETPADNETPGENELTEAQITESKNLYKALTGPQANAIIAALAAQAGLLPKPSEAPLTKKEEVAARREIRDIVKDALGPEYAFLQDKIGKIFDEVATQQRQENESRFAELQQTNVEREVVTAYEKLAAETKGESKKFEARMAQLSEEVPIGSMNVTTYMKRLYAIANSEKRSSPQQIADKIRKNANDAPARLASKGSAAQASHPAPETPAKRMSLDESIAWAQDQIKQGKR